MTELRTYGSLFSGVGGFDMGFDQAGFECLFQVEWDKHCQSVLARHWPDVPRWSDVQDVDGSVVPPVDVLIFGSPCQDLSVAGKRAGIDGGRSSMFFEATRIIREMRNATRNTYPRVVVWENVPGALSSNRGADFQAVIDEMADCGSYLTEWAVLDAQHFGVPQRRRRIFLVAVLDPATASRCPDPLFPVAEGRRGDYQKGIPTGQDITGTLTQSIRGSQSTAVKVIRSGARDADGNLPPEVWKETDPAPTLNSMDNTGETRATVIAYNTFGGNKRPDRPEGGFYTEETDTTKTISCDGLNPAANQGGTVIAFATNQRSEARELGDLSVALSAEPGTNQQTYIAEPTIAFTAQRLGEAPRIYEDSTPALLSRMGTGGNNTPMVTAPAVRRLTPLECERLMGWPEIQETARIVLCIDHQKNLASVVSLNLRKQKLALSAEKIEFNDNALSVGNGSRSNYQDQINVAELRVVINCEDGHIAITDQNSNLLRVVNAATFNLWSVNQGIQDAFARLVALTRICLDQIALDGVEEQQANKACFIRLSNGLNSEIKYGGETEDDAFDAISILGAVNLRTMSITSVVGQSSPISDLSRQILFSYVVTVIGGFIRDQIQTKTSFCFDLTLHSGHTRWTADGTEQVDTHRYKQCGNGVATPVARWVARQIADIATPTD